MKIVRVVESKRWKHASGRTASLYGASPWTGAPGDCREDWTLETVGYTWECDNGTIGLGIAPAKTRADALVIMAKHNAKYRVQS